jgi:hypothetical protein
MNLKVIPLYPCQYLYIQSKHVYFNSNIDYLKIFTIIYLSKLHKTYFLSQTLIKDLVINEDHSYNEYHEGFNPINYYLRNSFLFI